MSNSKDTHEARTLDLIAKRPGLRSAEIAKLMARVPSVVTSCLGNLRKKGCAKRVGFQWYATGKPIPKPNWAGNGKNARSHAPRYVIPEEPNNMSDLEYLQARGWLKTLPPTPMLADLCLPLAGMTWAQYVERSPADLC